MKNAEMKVISFDKRDVIATSGLSATWNVGTVTYNGKAYTQDQKADFYNAFNTANNLTAQSSTKNQDRIANGNDYVVGTGYQKIGNYWNNLDGTYVFGTTMHNGTEYDTWSKQQ